MTDKTTKKMFSPKQMAKQYFAEARGWDTDISVRIKQSEKRAWRCCILFTIIAVLQGIGLVCLLPLKTIEPFVIRVDNNTGLVDVVSTLASHGEVKQQAQELMDKYWLGQYLRHRESYQWETRSYDRTLVGLMSAELIQQEYAVLTDPKSNSKAPVNEYGQNAQVTFISMPSALLPMMRLMVKNEPRHWCVTTNKLSALVKTTLLLIGLQPSPLCIVILQ